MRDIGKNIKLLRQQKNMTQDELAEALFVTRQTVSNYETGRSRPDVEMLLKIAEVLNADANTVLYGPPGVLYIYLCYGMHNLLNVVTGRDGIPQGVLIRACVTADGPGKLTKALGLDRTLHGTALADCADVFWFEDDGLHPALTTKPRVGIGYASPEDQARLWRFCGKNLPPL